MLKLYNDRLTGLWGVRVSRKRRKEKVSDEELLDALGGLEEALKEEVRGADVDDVLARADGALADYDYERAFVLFKGAVWLSSGDSDAVCRLATFLVDDFAYFDEAVRLLSSPACGFAGEGDRLLARAYFLSGRREEALDVYRRVNKSGGDLLSWKRQGALLKDMGRWPDAVAALDRALSFDGADAEARVLKAECEKKAEGELSDTLDRLEAALEVADGRESAARLLDEISGQPWYPQRYYQLKSRLEQAQLGEQAAGFAAKGRAAEEEGQLDHALAAYRRAGELDPENVDLSSKIADLSKLVEQGEVERWVKMGNSAYADNNCERAILYYMRALDRDPGAAGAEGEASVLFEMAGQLLADLGKMPSTSQVQALESLYAAHRELSGDNLEGARMQAARAGSLVDQLPHGERIRDELERRRREVRLGKAEKWMTRAQEAEQAGESQEAARLYERVANVEGYAQAAEAAARAEVLKEGLFRQQETASTQRRLESLIGQEAYFDARRELEKRVEAGASVEGADELRRTISEGIETRYPLEVTRLEDTAPLERSDWDSADEEIGEFLPENTFAVSSGPTSHNLFLLAEDRLLVLDTGELRPRCVATVPPEARLERGKGFVLHALAPGDRDALVFINSDKRRLLYLAHQRSRLELLNVVDLDRIVMETRQKVTRWFSLCGPDEQLLVCQSAPGAQSKASMYAVSLTDGRLLYDEDFGYAMSYVRPLAGTSNQFVVHRYPQPSQMRRPGYFTFAFLDNRLRFVKRFTIKPDEMDGTLVESTRFVRVSPHDGNMYFLFRYFDMYTGQLVSRPLAFVAMDKKGKLLYAASDSSTLVREKGDLEPVGELLRHGDKDILALLTRKKDVHFVTLVDTTTFKVLETIEVDPNQSVVAIEAGATAGRFVLVTLDRKKGIVRMTNVALPE